MTTPRDPLYAGCRDPAEIISCAVWLYVRFPLSRRTVEERLAARGLSVTCQTVRQCGLEFGRACANRMRRRAPRRGDTWPLDEVVLTIAGKQHWLWRAVDQEGFVPDVLVQSRRDEKAAKRLFRKLPKTHGRAPRVPITDKLGRYAAAKREIIPPPAFHRLRRWNLGRLRPASSTGRTKARTTGRTTPTHRPGGESRS